MDTLAFSGGEPLLNRDIFEIAAYSREQGFKNSLLTNGKLVESLSKNHDKLTGSKGSFQGALMGRIALMNYDVSVSAVIVVNKQNLSDLRDTLRDLGICEGISRAALHSRDV